MITRLVKLTFHPENTDRFQTIFKTYRSAIRKSPGCKHLEAWQDISDPRIFFTYSKWEDAADLENYRHSETFREVWGQTKVLFAERPQAWSVNQISTDNENQAD
ncbi:MAG: antibiotic biosynthesis monooxygenase [Bacteroidetes bacterium]|nr:antibiotic biosynthesis monooxygenase [Bacteroidota bacterium]